MELGDNLGELWYLLLIHCDIVTLDKLPSFGNHSHYYCHSITGFAHFWHVAGQLVSLTPVTCTLSASGLGHAHFQLKVGQWVSSQVSYASHIFVGNC